MDDYRWLDATAQADLVRRAEVKPGELVEAALARIEVHSPDLNAVVTPITPRAEQADGPFAAVPFLVKDLALEVAGTRFTEGSRWLASNVSAHDQELARRYRQAGLVIIGKTNTCEFGLSPTVEPALFGPTRNPWDRAARPAGPAEDLPPRSPPGWFPWPMATTSAGQSATRRRGAGCSGSNRRGRASPSAPSTATWCPDSPPSTS